MTKRFFDDPTRFALANELHARPFPRLTAPCRALYLAVRPEGAERRDLDADRARLIDLIDRHGGAHPPPGAAHYSAELGRFVLKWESHTEFVSYTLFIPEVAEEPFSGENVKLFPEEWLASLDGQIVSAAMVRIETAETPEAAAEYFLDRLSGKFVHESLATAFVVDQEALIASDFRIHEDGFARIAVVAVGGVGPRRLGRIVQRVLEIECYKTFALMTLPVARNVSRKVTELDDKLSALITNVAGAPKEAENARETLDALTSLSAEAERLSTEAAYRFGAAGAYEAIVNDRILALREARLAGRQLYSEFMKRRFDPAMRTCRSAERRLAELSDRLARASALLSTRVNVAVEAQNQSLLESMNRRADLQLRLQQTVEGLSVVAISYYALNLVAAIVAPFAAGAGVSKAVTTAALAIPVIAVVWWSVRRIRKRWER